MGGSLNRGEETVMRFVVCTGVDAETGADKEFVLNLSFVTGMVSREGLTEVYLEDGRSHKVKESPAEIFRKEDAMALCINAQGTELQQVMAEEKKRLKDNLAEEDRIARERLEKDRKAWDRREREDLELGIDRLLMKKLTGYAKDHFNEDLGEALRVLVIMGTDDEEEFSRASNLALDVAEAVAKAYNYSNSGRMISELRKERKANKKKQKHSTEESEGGLAKQIEQDPGLSPVE